MDEIRGFSPVNARRIARQIPRLEKWRDPPNVPPPSSGLIFPPDGTWILNDSGAEIPARGLMAIDALVAPTATFPEPYAKVKKPSTTFRRQYLVNGPDAIAAGLMWFIEWQPRPEFQYDTSWGTPGVGESGGPKPDSWLLWKNYPVICDVWGLRDTTNKILVGELHAINHWVGKTTGAVTGGTSSTTSYRFYTTAGGIFSGADAGFTTVPPAYSKVDIASGKFIKITPMGNVCLLEPLECNA